MLIDDYSRYIISWMLCKTMKASDVKETIDLAIKATGIERIAIRHRPRILTDNGSCYIAGELREYLENQGMAHTRGKPFFPMSSVDKK